MSTGIKLGSEIIIANPVSARQEFISPKNSLMSEVSQIPEKICMKVWLAHICTVTSNTVFAY